MICEYTDILEFCTTFYLHIAICGGFSRFSSWKNIKIGGMKQKQEDLAHQSN